MPISRRRIIDRNIEKNTLILLITSTQALNTLAPLIQPEFFESPYSRKVCKWIKEFWLAYKEAPGKLIQNIYESERINLNPKEEEEIADFLETLSEKFIEEGGEKQNTDYLIEKASRYLKSRSLSCLVSKVQGMLEMGELEEAEAELSRKSLLSQLSSNWVFPLDDPVFINQVFDEEEEETFVELGGGLKELCGNPRRGEFWGVMGFTGRGKTWYMWELARWALESGRRVAWISLEMLDKRFAIRPYMNLTAAGFKNDGIYKYPVFDCRLNQNNTCKKLDRVSRMGKPREFDPKDDRYLPCTYCREMEGEERDFDPAVWYEELIQPRISRGLVIKQLMEQYGNQYGTRLFSLISFPSFGADVGDIINALDALEFSKGWIPDVICVDYADILRPDDTKVIGRDRIDHTWKLLKGLAETRRAWVITPTQSNREGADKGLLSETNTGEDIRKLHHVDVMLTVNQTKAEKSQNFARIGQLKARWEDFDPMQVLMVLQHLKTGQTNLDSCLVRWERKGKFEEEEDV